MYLFPWRPWLRAVRAPKLSAPPSRPAGPAGHAGHAGPVPGWKPMLSTGCPWLSASLTERERVGVEPYRKGLGVLAPWVPAQGGAPSRLAVFPHFRERLRAFAGMQDLERQQINDWLSDWLVEAEASARERERVGERARACLRFSGSDAQVASQSPVGGFCSSRGHRDGTVMPAPSSFSQELRQLRWYSQAELHMPCAPRILRYTCCHNSCITACATNWPMP